MSQEEETEEKVKKPLNDYARYSGIAFQMIATILLGAFGGRKLDQWLETKFPVFTLVLTLLGVAVAMYMVIREFLKKK